MRLFFPLLCTVAILFTRLALSAGNVEPLVILIPGSGSSGSEIYIENLNWATPLIGGNKYFGEFQKSLKRNGAHSLVCPKEKDRDSRTIEQRAEDCAQVILGLTGGECENSRKIILVGHSMGGLVARTLAQDSRVQGCIATVMTISTPNRGTPIADYAIERKAKDDENFDLFGKLVELIHFTPEYLGYLRELRVDRSAEPAARFRAQDMPDHPEISYFSVTNSVEHTLIPVLEVSRKIISKELEKRGLDRTGYGAANDGIVPEFSMPHGTVIARLPVHHWASVCTDPVRFSSQCKLALETVVPLVIEQYERVTSP